MRAASSSVSSFDFIGIFLFGFNGEWGKVSVIEKVDVGELLGTDLGGMFFTGSSGEDDFLDGACATRAMDAS